MRIEDITPEFLHQNGINPEGMVFSQHHLPYNRRLKDFSRELRQHGEKSEAMLWKRLKSKQVGFTFNRQKPILNFIADFYCKELALVIEIDGASHFSHEACLKDQERDRQMRVIGLEVIRVRDAEVRSNPDGIANYIGEQCRVIRDGNFG